MKRILVTGAGGPAASNFIKSLRMVSEDFYIVGTDTNPLHLELAPVDTSYLLPKCDSPSYIPKLNGIIKKEKIDLVYPQPDIEVAVISENREEIYAKVFLPRKETIRTCQDKMALTKVLEKNDVPIPISFSIKNKTDLDRALKSLLALNSDKAWLRAVKGAGGRASLPIKDAKHGGMWIDYWKKNRGLDWDSFMISEYLPGREFAFQSIWKDGEVITSQARERLEYLFAYLTPSGQTSSPTVAKTVHRDDVNRIAIDAVLAVDKSASGVFCVDLKENTNGVPCVTEINSGRFFTTSNFFSEAGVNMPYMYVKLAFNEPFERPPKFNPLPEGWYWIRLMDMGHKLIKGEKWKNRKLS
jgi:carbamoyl-phosphate synthase large subunit